MDPVTLRTARLVLDQPGERDVDAMAEFCTDPLFEANLVTPWPYTPADAEYFIRTIIPATWLNGDGCEWSLRDPGSGDFLGMIGWRRGIRMIGYWIGAPYRGHGFMTEAATAVTNWLFAAGETEIGWECVIGNQASVGVARAAGFTFTGEGVAEVPSRDGSRPLVWQGVLRATDSREPKAGWPT
jgi:RimJ/RimL family protein N-acetyltransferase